MKFNFKRYVTCLLALIFMFCLSSEPAAAAAMETKKITQSDMIYFIMTDRFYDGDKSNDEDVRSSDLSAYQGGDFQGIIDKLDYIKGLGFTAIWISPVVKNQAGGYHGYWATDFYKTNEHFGSIDKLKELVSKAHSKGIKVIFDLVVNHTGQDHPWVKDPSHSSWFHDKVDINDYNNEKEVENGWLAGLPDLNQENPEVKKYLIDMAKWWIKETKIDGYRLDTVKHVPKTFWTDFTKEIKKEYPNFYFVGEVLNNSPSRLAQYQNTGIDGLLDYPMYYAINDAFGKGSASSLDSAISQSDIYKNSNLMGTFIDNHDVPRFMNNLTDLKEQRLKSALTFMMTYTGIPIMYYGTEIGMEGGNDPDNRRMMDFKASSPVRDYVKKLTSLRKSNEVFTHGDIQVVSSDSDYICYSRKYKKDVSLCVFNTSDSDKEIEFNIPEDLLSKNTSFKDLLTSKGYKMKGDKFSVKLAPMQTLVLINKENSYWWIVCGGAAGVVVIVSGVVLMAKRKRRGIIQ